VPRQRLKEKSRLLPSKAIDIMTQWYDKNYNSPYPSFRECEQMAIDGCISINQVKQWFVNVRRRTQNKNRITRTTGRQVNHLIKSENLNFYQDISPTHNSRHSNEYKNQEANSSFYPSSPNFYPTFQPSEYQPQYQLPSSSPSYPNYYTPNYTLSPVFTNYTINYMPLSSPSSFTYPTQSSYNHGSFNRSADSYLADSQDNSLDYSATGSPRTSNSNLY